MASRCTSAAAADRVFRQGCGLGQYGRIAEPAELFSLTLARRAHARDAAWILRVLGTNAGQDPQAVLDQAIATLLSGEVSPETRQTLEKRMSDPQILQASLDDPVKEVNRGMVAGLVLGALEFQKRR